MSKKPQDPKKTPEERITELEARLAEPEYKALDQGAYGGNDYEAWDQSQRAEAARELDTLKKSTAKPKSKGHTPGH